MANHACACCGYRTLSSPSRDTYEICPICFWEDDPTQAKDPDFAGGANAVSLRQGQANFIAFGACEQEMRPNVRQPRAGEERAEDWRLDG